MKNVELYTQPSCPPCEIVKQFLKHNNISYKEYDVSKDVKARNRMIEVFQSYSTPTVKVNDDVVKGFDLQTLEKLLDLA
ncbi:NrdH-redoxin [Priestia aryabhattai]|uniref:glutaredoxin domain-containing protein n=1 Tax=Bacillaceae TaxID=186817 RepID=UPI000BA04842|nr:MULTISPECIES: glutaredoxin domain-containing protein [Bacillaceae]MDT2047524.1 glutaredoxin domain-containing protein [Priestia flexa]OZT12421.1 NrdH-redoxin [Priestia aryabhattai]TDB55264.1 NrdH-redoxin [Bacillus sp. CBEL-1]USY56355.1 glutathione S-transferase N-terminal domain-containing protein [Bacillus sp. 1780r2a1]